MRAPNDQESLSPQESWICLDFANTLEWHSSDHPEEHVQTYEDLVSWARDVGILEDQEVVGLLQQAKKRPSTAKKVYEKAISLREAMYRMFSRIAAGGEPEKSDLNILNASLSEALPHLRLTQTKGGLDWRWFDEGTGLDRILWPIAHSAADLLTSGKIDRVGECADDRGCGWLFFDMSRNRSRRWCDMKDCGNRDKVRRYYARKKQTD
ncbi:MAG: CGNR zinc finger domain-containing protein [Fidelibacterota bacterium]